MKSLALSAFPRTNMRRKGARQVRSTGRIPANIYGKTAPAQNLELDSKEFSNLVGAAHSEIILVDLSIKDDARPVRLALVQDVQHHPLHGHVLHVDLHEVQPTEKVTVRLPIETTGECAGVKAGGTLEHVLLRIRVRALPKDLPEQILVDVSALEVGKTIHIGNISVPEGVELLGNKDTTVLACAAPLTAEPETPAVAEGAKQPEMIKEKKTDEAAPAGKPADKKK